MYIYYLVCFSYMKRGQKEHRIFKVVACTTEIDKVEKAFIKRYSSEYDNLEVLKVEEERWLYSTHV